MIRMYLTDRGNTLKDESEPNNFMKKSFLYLKEVSLERTPTKTSKRSPSQNSILFLSMRSKARKWFNGTFSSWKVRSQLQKRYIREDVDGFIKIPFVCLFVRLIWHNCMHSQPFNSQNRVTCNFSLEHSYIIQQIRRKLLSWSNNKFLSLINAETCRS